MNKELAIKLLRGSVLGTNEQLHEAVFIAIKALKAEPVKQGKWIKVYGDHISMGHRPWVVCCSVCDRVNEPTNYCPNCGAKMSESEVEE